MANTGKLPLYAEAQKMKLLALCTHGHLRARLWDNFFCLQKFRLPYKMKTYCTVRLFLYQLRCHLKCPCHRFLLNKHNKSSLISICSIKNTQRQLLGCTFNVQTYYRLETVRMPYLNHTSIITHHDNNGLVCPRLFFIHSGCFYSTSSSPLLLRGAPNTARILCRGFTPKRHRQLRVKDLSEVPMRRLELDSNL